MNKLSLDRASSVPYYRQIIDQIKTGVILGDWQPGNQLPTIIELADQLRISINTVSKAYQELVIHKIAEKRQGSGEFIICGIRAIGGKEQKSKLATICFDFLKIAETYGFSVEDIINQLKRIKNQGNHQLSKT